MPTLVNIAEVLAGEALVAPGGLVDSATAMAGDDALWSYEGPKEVMAGTRAPAAPAAHVFA